MMIVANVPPARSRRAWRRAGVAAVVLAGLSAWGVWVWLTRPAPPGLPRRATLRGEGSKFEIPLAFSPDGALLASRSDQRRVTLWDVASGRPRATVESAGDDANASFSPDSRFLALSRSEQATIFHTVLIVEVATGRQVAALEVGKPNLLDFRFLPDGSTFQLVAWAYTPRPTSGQPEPLTVRTWDAATWREQPARSLDVPRSWGTFERAGAFSPDARVLASVSPYAPDVQLWDTITGAKLATLPTPLIPPETGNYVCEFSPDGQTLAVGRNNAGTLELWDLATRTPRQTLRALSPDDRVEHVRFASASPRTLVTAVSNWSILKNPIAQGMEWASRRLGLSPGGSKVPVDVLVWDVPSGRPRVRLRGETYGIVSLDGSTLATAGEGGAVTLWDLTPR
jgi:WD40 repeat protein